MPAAILRAPEAESAYGASMPETPECRDCGVCCSSLLEDYVNVPGSDYERLGVRADELTQFNGTHAFMRMHDGHCSALERSLVSGQFFCNAYETRPQVCRDLARGSGACRGEIDAKQQRALLVPRLGRGSLPVVR